MLAPERTNSSLLARAAEDYAVVRRAIAYISRHWRDQPDVDAVARAAAVTSDELHHLFRRWAGLTPKAFLQALTVEHARALLRDSASVLDTAYEVGLSGPGRLHDLFVAHEAMSPGEWKAAGAGLTMRYGYHPSPFGTALLMATERGLAGLAFADPGEERSALADMQGRWPKAKYVEDPLRAAALARKTPVIAGEVAALAEHAMARHHERQRVLADRRADRARGLGCADFRGEVGVGGRAAEGHGQKRLPHPHLEVGADEHDTQRVVGPPGARLENAARKRGGA